MNHDTWVLNVSKLSNRRSLVRLGISAKNTLGVLEMGDGVQVQVKRPLVETSFSGPIGIIFRVLFVRKYR